MAYSVDPDQTASLGAVLSGQHCLPRHDRNLGSLLYELLHEKTNILHMGKQRGRSASR